LVAPITIFPEFPLQPIDLVPAQSALQTFALLEADLCLHLIEDDEASRATLCALVAGQALSCRALLYCHWLRNLSDDIVALC
jgi:hypothetical protein